MKKILSLLAVFAVFSVQSQVVYTDIAFPVKTDSITVFYNAAQGNAALQGQSTIFMHTGIITNASAYDGDWKNIPFIWGEADPLAAMTPVGNNIYKKSFRINTFYGFGSQTNVKALMFVFRNANGTLVGKNADGSDITLPIYPSTTDFTPYFTAPLVKAAVFEPGNIVKVEVKSAISMTQCNIFLDGQFIHQGTGNSVSYTFNAGSVGKHTLVFQAESGLNTKSDTTYFMVRPQVVTQDPPSGTKLGINYINGTTVRLCLEAPNKEFVYAIGDFSNWEADNQYFCKRSSDGLWYWTDITVSEGVEYSYQYFVDGKIKIGDPYCDKVLDEFDDNGINSFIYPNLKPYPFGKTSEKVSVFQTNQTPYNWQYDNAYTKPLASQLVIYELLIRDFAMRKAYTTIRDTLDYFKRLGVNAIHIMPITEFEGNNSWGYSPNFFFAPDKKYGPREALKELIDVAHSKGIVVILDIVPNHAFGQNSYVRLYWDNGKKRPADNSPFFNPVATHPFSVGYDFNHESPFVRNFFKRVFRYWIEEYHFDGYRVDLSKGLTQTNSGSDIGYWSQYDQSRVNILFDYYNDIRSYSDDYVILEHLGNNDEETVLANGGFMLWSKATEQYNQATMGYGNNSNFEFQTSFLAKGWSWPNAVSYMESHDEERLMFKNTQFGNQSNGIDTRSIPTALKRMEAAATCFFTIPGPKLMWQFGELGYDFSINWPSNTEASRTSPKPVRWDYYFDNDRHRLFKIYSALIKLKTTNSTFDSWNYSMDVGGTGKRIWVNSPQMNVCVGANFDMVAFDMVPGFQHTGTWYDYFTGQAINVSNQNDAVNFQPGEYHLWTDVQLPLPDLSGPPVIPPPDTGTFVPDISDPFHTMVYPVPSSENVHFAYNISEKATMRLQISDLNGKLIRTLFETEMTPDKYLTTWNGFDENGNRLPAGVYVAELSNGQHATRMRLVLE